MRDIDLITGGRGFLGRHLVRALWEQGRQVRVLDIAAGGDDLPPEVEVHVGSVTDPDTVRRAVSGVRRIFHLAAVPELWAADPDVFDRVNDRGTVNVLQAAQSETDLEVFVHTSSEVVLVPRPGLAVPRRLDESVELAVDEVIGRYAAAKRRAELAVLDAASERLPTLSVIPTMPLGPGDVNRTPPTRMIADLLAGRTPAYADVLLNAVDARDCAQGHILAAEWGASGHRYLLSGYNVTMSALLGELGLITQARLPRRRIPKWLARGFALADTWAADHITHKPPTAPRDGVTIACRQQPFDNTKARTELGFRPRPLSITLADTAAWLQSP